MSAFVLYRLCGHGNVSVKNLFWDQFFGKLSRLGTKFSEKVGSILKFLFRVRFFVFLSIVLLKASQFSSIVATCHCGPDVLALCMHM